MVVLPSIWLKRNRRMFQGKSILLEAVLVKAHSLASAHLVMKSLAFVPETFGNAGKNVAVSMIDG